MSNSSVYSKMKYWTWVVPTDKVQYRVGVHSGVLIYLFCGSTPGVALLIPDQWREKLDKLSKCLEEGMKHLNGSEVHAKVVGSPAGHLHDLQKHLEKHSIRLEKLVEKPLGTEVLYFPDQGRLRVSLEIAPPVVPEPAIDKSGDRGSERVFSGPIKILIVDDSKTIRDLLSKIFSSDAELEVVATADRPSQVEELIQKHKPDVITLDIHMPEMDGVTLLKKIFPKYRIPTVMISSISMEEGPMVLNALESGAVDYIKKPDFKELSAVKPVIIEKVKAAAQANLVQGGASKVTKKSTAKLDLNTIVAIGSSTGGTEALRAILTQLPKEIPPIIIVQHIPPVFSLAFAKRLNELCAFDVKEAEDQDELRPGQVYVAPGGKQMKVFKSGTGFKLEINNDDPVNRHRPSVDYLFDSVAEVIKGRAIGLVLTGMGADGAKGLLKMKKSGARTICQDEKSCVVFGMPKEAIKAGGADQVMHLDDIPDGLIQLLSSGHKAAS